MSDGDFEDLFYVLLPDNQVETLSLDELDEAFQEDRIEETALVCRVGGNTWVTLAELASVDDEPQPQAPSPPVYVAPMRPPAAYVPPSSPVSRVPDSMAPYAADLSPSLDDDLDFEALALRPKRRALWVVSGLATMGAVAVAALVVAGGAAASAPAMGQTAAMLTPPAVLAASPPAVETTPAPPAAATPSQAASASPPEKDPVSEDMKRALLEADAKPVTKKGVVAVKKGAKLRKHRPAKPKSKRSKGKGNAFDPLNGNL